MTTFEEKLAKYADVIVRVGLNIQPGQKLFMGGGLRGIDLEAAPLARAIARSAYQAGASMVDVKWADDEITRLRIEFAPEESLTDVPQHAINEAVEHLKEGNAILTIRGKNPDALAGLDPTRVKTVIQSGSKASKPMMEYITSNAVNWLVIAAPTRAWVQKVFPDMAPDEAIDAMWDTIFKICRIDQPDPVAAWKQHSDNLNARTEALNARRYDALHFKNAETDITVGLPEGHLWRGGGLSSQGGIDFVPNIPTEEVFSMPHRERVNGTVTSSKPLSYGGKLIDKFTLKVENGRVVDYSAVNNQDTLQGLLETDDNAAFFGEIALVSKQSPIAQVNRLFFDTLYDENAASHLALGQAYRMTMQDGTSMDDDAFATAGGNNSLVHVDFMFGTPDMNVDGIKADGTRDPVMRDGDWAFDV